MSPCEESGRSRIQLIDILVQVYGERSFHHRYPVLLDFWTRAFGRGRPSAWAEEYREALHDHIMRKTVNPEDVRRGEDGQILEAWLKLIMKCCAIDACRATESKRRQTANIQPSRDGESPWDGIADESQEGALDGLVRKEVRVSIYRALARVARRDRRAALVLAWTFIHNDTQRQMAGRLGFNGKDCEREVRRLKEKALALFQRAYRDAEDDIGTRAKKGRAPRRPKRGGGKTNSAESRSRRPAKKARRR